MTETEYKNICSYIYDKESEISSEIEQQFPTKESRETPQYSVIQERKKLWGLRTIFVERLYRLNKLKESLREIMEELNGLEISIQECESNLGVNSTFKEIEYGKTYTIRKDELPF